MKPVLPAVVYGILFALWTSSIYFLCGLAMSFFHGDDINKIYSDIFTVFLAVSAFASMFFYEVMSMIEERNREGRERMEKLREEESKRKRPPQ